MKKKIVLLVLLTFLLTGCGKDVITVAGTIVEEGQTPDGYIEMQEFELKESAEVSDRQDVNCCAVLIPVGYQESADIPGMYVHEMSPLDSSNIYYSVSAGGGTGKVASNLTKETYEKLVEEAHAQAGLNADIKIETFEEIDMEGVPAYKIRSSYEVSDEGTVEQLVYLILAEDTYTVTYSQMADDELMVDFKISDGEIRLVREEDVSLAKSDKAKK